MVRLSAGKRLYPYLLLNKKINIFLYLNSMCLDLCTVAMTNGYVPSATQSNNMRVAVCEVLGDILVRVLCGDALGESGKADRDRFFDTLQEHLHDTHSHVRARVLQVFTRIVNSKVSSPASSLKAAATLFLWRYSMN